MKLLVTSAAGFTGSTVYDTIILAVAHHQSKQMGTPTIRALVKRNVVLYDLKYVLSASESDLRL